MFRISPAHEPGPPLYRRIIACIEDAIESGRLAPGQRLPAERRLAALFGVNRSTVVWALQELADRGVLLRRQGSGTYVNPEKWGLQIQPLFRWHAPVRRMPASRDAWSAQNRALATAAAQGDHSVLDLSRDILPPDLLPAFSGPGTTWGRLVSGEQDEEAARLGTLSFRKAVQTFLRERLGLRVPFEQILITSGSRQALFLVSQCLLRPGDAIGVEAPSYFYSLPVFQAAGLRMLALPTDESGITVEGLDALHSRTPVKMIFINPVFHNPTGALLPAQRRQALLDYCAAKHIPIFEDDAYSLLSFSPDADVAPLKGQDRHNRVIYSGSLSTYAGPNLRAGWLVAPEPVIAQLAHVRAQMDAGLSVLPQLLGEHYCSRDSAAHLARLRRVLAERAQALTDWLETTFGRQVRFTRPGGGLYIYARATPEVSAVHLAETLLKHRVLVTPGEVFGDGAPAFRCNFGWFRAPLTPS